MQENKFWVVWNPNGRQPTHKHRDFESAINESERLARLNGGDTFYVLEAVTGRRVDNMIKIDLVGSDSDIPF